MTADKIHIRGHADLADRLVRDQRVQRVVRRRLGAEHAERRQIHRAVVAQPGSRRPASPAPSTLPPFASSVHAASQR